MRLPRLASALILWPLLGAVAKDPTVAFKKFEQPPRNVFFFDDSNTALALISDIEGSVGEVYITKDAGGEWKQIDDFPEGQPYVIYPHPTDKNVAVTLGRSKTHWVTFDQGEKWQSFKTAAHPSRFGSPIKFHASNSKKFLYQGLEECDIFTMACLGSTWYTTDGFQTLEPLVENRKDCLWAKSTDRFTTGNDGRDGDRILCVTPGKYSDEPEDFRLLITDDFFHSAEEPKMGSRTVNGISNVAAVKGYMVAAAKAAGSKELALYVTDDTEIWHRAEFGGSRIEEDAYTILESTNYSIQVDVKTTDRASMGELFSSNSNGTYFTANVDHTNRNDYGIVDFEKIQDIQGILLVNTVDNWKEVEKTWLVGKEIKSQITFDDGRNWQPLKVADSDKDLHVHSVTEQRQNGKVFSSAAPGLVLGVGNTGKTLGAYATGDLYMSADAGETWQKALEGPHLYEFGGAGSIIIATLDKGDTDEIRYSTNFGQDWDTYKLPEEIGALKIFEVTTVTDSTSLRFLLSGLKHTSKGDDYYAISLDFAGLLPECSKVDDYESWYPRVDADDKATCIMGHKQKFQRRKPKSKCLVDLKFAEPLPVSEPCECTEADFECDYNFKKVDGKCVAAGPVPIPADACQGGETEFEGSSGYRLIPGDNCKRTDDKQLDAPVMHPCNNTGGATPGTNDTTIRTVEHTFKNPIVQYHYLEHQVQSEDNAYPQEPIVALTKDGVAHITYDHGKTWKAVPGVDDNVIGLYPHSYNNDYIYLITSSNKVHYSKNNGKNWHNFEAPEPPPPQRNIQILMFHSVEPDWLMWIGGKNCKGGADPDCHTVAHVSTKGGEEWTAMLSYVQKCQFVPRTGHEKRALCEQYMKEDIQGPLQLLSSDDFFEHKNVHFEDVVNFATMSEFVVVAAKTEDKKYLRVDTSIDGEIFAQAAFPPKFEVPHQMAYTVLDSSTHAIFMHVTVNAQRGQEYGSIIKSNSNGTEYVLSISNVNRNEDVYVDFEKVASLEGVAIVNIVSNIAEVEGGANKKLKTKITHNDGADWALIPAPAANTDGKPYKCINDGIDNCALHLHGYSERDDPRSTFGSPSAIGLVMGVGNVGPYLSDENTETYISEDGGVSWKVVMPGRWLWDYGDQGGVIAIVEKGVSTRSVYYSTDRGDTWKKHNLDIAKDVVIKQITTVPSDNSRRFLLWGDDFTISVDFTGLTNRECVLNDEKPTADDYEFFRPKHPLKEANDDGKDCLFGHEAQYHRKKKDSLCYNGPRLDRLHSIVSNCSCTRSDFECDYNYERQSGGSCALVPGLEPIDHQQVCFLDSSLIEYYDPTGYRRIPLTTCEGGKEMDLTSRSHPCPGKEPGYNKKHGISGIGLFFAVVIPIAAAAGIGYFVWQKFGDKLGSIRLGDGPSLYNSNRGSGGGNDWVQYPVMAVSAVVAVVAALPMVLGAAWRGVRSLFPGGYGGRTYTSRQSFARGRGDYAAVDADEGELLGDDSDEEV